MVSAHEFGLTWAFLDASRLGCRAFGRKPEGRSDARPGGDVPGGILSLVEFLEEALCNR